MDGSLLFGGGALSLESVCQSENGRWQPNSHIKDALHRLKHQQKLLSRVHAALKDKSRLLLVWVGFFC